MVKKVDRVVMCKDGHTGAILTSILFSMLQQKSGHKTSLFFYKEALIAIVNNNYVLEAWWEKYLDKTLEILKNHNLPSDPVELMKIAVVEGVTLNACGLWVEIIGKDALPENIKIEPVPFEELSQFFGEAKQIVTGL